MKLRSRILALVLAVVLVLGMMPVTAMAEGFARTVTWQEDLFTDVTQEDWFYDNVKGLYELGLMIGYGNGLFQPDSSISLAETLTVAARIHAISTYGEESFVQEEPWYQVYADYALKEGLIDAAPEDIGRQATRLEFAHILARTMPEEALAPINDVPNGSIPDLADDEAVYLLYRAGVLMGDDEAGTFRPNSDIKRSEVAAIVTRMILPELRHREDTPDTGTDETAPTESLPAETEPQPEVSVSVDIEVDENGAVKSQVAIDGTDAKATVPAGVAAQEGTQQLTLTVSEMEASTGNITLEGSETLSSYDVHIEGVSSDNQVPILVELGMALEPGFNMGNLSLYHVEDGVTNLMTQVTTLEEVDTHNEFYYDPATGVLTMAMATFSEIAVVADTTQPWEGNYDYSWYTGSDIAVYSDAATADYTIANADQLAAFSAIVGGMDSQTQDSFTGKTVKLIADINLNDAETSNKENLIFYPIGYYNSDGTYEKTNTAITSGFYTFEGTFDGNGHTIKNFYQNTWEMKGDHNWYDAALQYYRDGMGLFGKVYGGTVKNLTVENFSSDGEIATTGVIAAYADCGATFENIAIFNCNPRVYNIGNGGIVGCVGWYAKETTEQKVTFKNITVDNSNKISALWGSWDVACGGIVGQYYPTSGQSSAEYPANAGIHFENCHVAAQIDVNNDVCANYQYYAYRYAGMMIGSIRENLPADENGYVYPNMDGITASGCTVHFGDWNDYYYCELVANSLASYTHDHQFSRLEQVKSVDVENKKVTDLDGNTTDIPTSGRYNYVVVNEANEDGTFNHATDNATCYHFVDGEIWDHEDAGTETVDGVDGVLKEDKQHIYLEFNQLFTGYGWGVTSKGLTDFEGITNMDITEGDHEESVKKFESVALESYTTETTVTIGELFSAIENTGVDIKAENVQVTVSPVGEDSTAGGTYTANTDDWVQGTLTFSGLGEATITIQDYYFCTPTTITVNITEPESVDKFAVKFPNTDTYLYRVGNANTVALGSLFEATGNGEIGTVDVTIAPVNGTTASGTYTTSTTDNWYDGTIQFSGTGPVAVTIRDDAYANEKTLNLEVVDATNVTAYSELGNKNSVLLNDITMSSGGSFYLSNATLYGNGFTFDVTDGAYTGKNTSSNYLISLANAALDNVQIIGAVYTEYGAQVKNDYNRALVLSTGNSTIASCYLSNTAAPVRVNGGNLEISNSTLKGGNFANLDIRNGHVVLDNVTTINQSLDNDKAADGTSVVGLGIVIYYENVLTTTTVEIKNTLTQYNHISDNDTFSNTYAQTLVKEMLGTNHTDLQLENNGVTWANAGIVSMTAGMSGNIIDSRSDKGTYTGKAVTFQGVEGYVYTAIPTATSIAATAPDYTTAGQGAIAPSYSFDYTTKNYVAKTDGSNDYCYEDNGTVLISMDEGDTFNWDTSILTATKNGQTLSYTVSMDGTDYTGKSIAFNTTGNYTVIYTYTDSNNYSVDESGNITTYAKTYTKNVHISVSAVKPSAKNAEFTFGSSNTASTKVTIGNNTYVMPDVTATSSTIGSTTVSGNTIYYPIVEIVMSDSNTTHTSAWNAYFPVFSGAVTITDYADGGTGEAVTYGPSTTTLPSGLSVVGDPSTLFKYQSSSSAGTDPVVKNNILVYSSPSISAKRDEYNTVVQYSYKDNAGTTHYYYIGYHAPAQSYSSICVTADTLVTLADGTQKEIQHVRVGEEVVAWNFYTGAYETVPVSLLQAHYTGNQNVLHLYFEDGTELKVLGEHGIFDADLNTFIFIDEYNVENYVGHSFVQQDGTGFKTVKLTGYEVIEEYTTAYTILSTEHYNVLLENMFTVTPAHVGDNFFNPFDIGEDMKYDEAAVQADIEKYGLYTYEDFDHVLTYEQFVALNLGHFKVSVGKGLITYDGLIYLIENFINNEDFNVNP